MAKNLKLYEQITSLEGTIKLLRNGPIYECPPQEVSEIVDILEAIKTRLEDEVGA